MPFMGNNIAYSGDIWYNNIEVCYLLEIQTFTTTSVLAIHNLLLDAIRQDLLQKELRQQSFFAFLRKAYYAHMLVHIRTIIRCINAATTY